MAVVGFDIGNLSSYVAVARGGGIETVDNEYSDRMTPSIIGFGERQRSMGNSAKTQQISNIRNTITDFKRFIGRKFNDPAVQEEMKKLPFKVIERKDGGVGFQVQYGGELEVFTPEQMTAVFLSKLKETAESNLHTKVVDCVISVPQYYTDTERRAVLSAASISGLNCLRVLNDTTAAALAYGIYKQDLPAAEEKPRNVVFVDMGNSSLQVSACAFNKGKLKVLATASDRNIGGRDFDRVLFEHFAKEVLEKNKMDIKSHPRATVRLLTACERVKKLMSSNATKLPLNVESIMDDRDIQSHISRAVFEELSADLLKRAEAPLRSVLEQSKCRLNEIHSVEIIGGSSRVPAVKEIIKTVFQKDCSTTLNQDEAVARGCALQCAILSPTFRVREFNVTDLTPYAINLLWQAEDGEMEVFPKNHQVPFTKMLTFYRTEPFQLDARYGPKANIPYPDNFIGSFIIKDVKPNDEGESSKVKVKVRVNGHGIFSVSSASIVEKKPPQPEEMVEEKTEEKQKNKKAEETTGNGETPMETEPQKDGAPESNKEATPNATPDGEANQEEAASQNNIGQENNENDENGKSDDKEGEGDKDKKAKNKIKYICRDLPVESTVPRLSRQDILEYQEQEFKMIAADKLEKDRADAKNAVEEYVYEMRNKLCDMLVNFVTEEDSVTLKKLLEQTEEWLYDEGEDEAKNVYLEKLDQLMKLGEPIVKRYRECGERPAAFDDLGRSLVLYRKFIDQWKRGDEKFSHIEKSDIEKVERAVSDKESWRDQKINAQNQLPLTKDPVVLTSQIRTELQSLIASCEPIVTKPKPKPKEEPPKEDAEKPAGDKEDEGNMETEPQEGGGEEMGSPVDAEKKADAANQEAMEID